MLWVIVKHENFPAPFMMPGPASSSPVCFVDMHIAPLLLHDASSMFMALSKGHGAAASAWASALFNNYIGVL